MHTRAHIHAQFLLFGVITHTPGHTHTCTDGHTFSTEDMREWWMTKVKCGALVNTIASKYPISIWINLMLSKFFSSMPFLVCEMGMKKQRVVQCCWFDNTKKKKTCW